MINCKKNKSMLIKDANKMFSMSKYKEALYSYKKFASQNPELSCHVEINIQLCEKLIKKELDNHDNQNNLENFDSLSKSVVFKGFGTINHMPLVSVIIVSFNSSNDLKRLFESLKNQSYSNLEVIVIENGEENTQQLCKDNFENVKYKKLDNVGFAEANNIAVEICSGELILLANPDCILDEFCVQELVDCIRFDAHAAVVCPKINFLKRYLRVTIGANDKFKINYKTLRNNFEYKKIFIRNGVLDNDFIESDDSLIIVLDIPFEELGELNLDVFSSSEISMYVKTGYDVERYGFPEETPKIKFDLRSYSTARYLINNAGSSFNDDEQPFDRGFGQYDDGKYFFKSYVNALCGCVALIRRIAFLDSKLFVSEFFAYYEDTELSRRIVNNNYKILYNPAAVAFHRHSESTEQNSTIWNTLVSRSLYIYNAIKNENIKCLKDFKFDYSDGLPKNILSKLRSLDVSLAKYCSIKALIKKNKKTVCIYNSYFSSMGGGEKHSLSFSELFNDEYQVYLASESDFSIDKLSKYFEIDLSKCNKIVCTNIDIHFTSKFDIFINATFLSRLVPKAKKNFYVVYFPAKTIEQDLLKSYIFLHDSDFCRRWAIKYWGAHRYKVILPTLSSIKLNQVSDAESKKKLIISVGRFNFDGHCKNHHEVISAFIEAKNSLLFQDGWRLAIIGSCDYTVESSVSYFNYIKSLVSMRNDITVIPNISHDQLHSNYKEASIYVHAAGMNQPVDKPELHEHFGITPHEAMLNGCYPIVYHIGGPAEQVIGLDSSSLFSDRTELINSLSLVSRRVEAKAIDFDSIINFARLKTERNYNDACQIFNNLL
jgi:GT2 family glycosyltransferase